MESPWGLQTPERGDTNATVSHLIALVVESWRANDVVGGTEMAGYFTADGVFDLGMARLEGRDAIEESLIARTARGPRTTRHIAASFRCTLDDDDHGSVEYIVTVYGADGDPVVPLEGPTTVGDIKDTFVRQDDGKWLIESRLFTPVFLAQDRFAPHLKTASNATQGEIQS